jgi:Rps23 Pro-64 3,4-dihydroxylase Tpa1-like proline 4-hydroxylase
LTLASVSSTNTAMDFALNPALDFDALAGELARSKRLQIRDFLTPASADALLDHLTNSTDWRHVINAGDKVYEIGCEELEAMDDAQRGLLDRKIDLEAAHGFQFRFDTIRVPDAEADRRAMARPLSDFASFLSSPEMTAWFRALTGRDRIEFADCQATRYRNGAFLTRHDDAIEGKQRYFAYVLNLTRAWRAEWGGLLFFPNDEAIRIDALVPEFNVLNLFEVGQQHAVSQVASYAPSARISVTGWLRSFAS